MDEIEEDEEENEEEEQNLKEIDLLEGTLSIK